MTSTPNYPNARYLAESEWLHAHINEGDVRIIDARFDVRE